MEIKHITLNKADFLDLLLLADESETMITRYLDRGEMFALYDDDLKSICVVTQEGKNLYEIKNLATYPPFQRQGYARRLIEYIENRYNAPGTILQVGTSDSPLTIPFYEHCGFRYSHRIPRFFTDNYPPHLRRRETARRYDLFEKRTLRNSFEISRTTTLARPPIEPLSSAS